jgi:hypothetical protein
MTQCQAWRARAGQEGKKSKGGKKRASEGRRESIEETNCPRSEVPLKLRVLLRQFGWSNIE